MGSTNPNLGEDTLLLEGAGDKRLELHHLPGIIVHPRLKRSMGMASWSTEKRREQEQAVLLEQREGEGRWRSKMNTTTPEVGDGVG